MWGMGKYKCSSVFGYIYPFPFLIRRIEFLSLVCDRVLVDPVEDVEVGGAQRLGDFSDLTSVPLTELFSQTETSGSQLKE